MAANREWELCLLLLCVYVLLYGVYAIFPKNVFNSFVRWEWSCAYWFHSEISSSLDKLAMKMHAGNVHLDIFTHRSKQHNTHRFAFSLSLRPSLSRCAQQLEQFVDSFTQSSRTNWRDFCKKGNRTETLDEKHLLCLRITRLHIVEISTSGDEEHIHGETTRTTVCANIISCALASPSVLFYCEFYASAWKGTRVRKIGTPIRARHKRQPLVCYESLKKTICKLMFAKRVCMLNIINIHTQTRRCEYECVCCELYA